MLRDIRQALRSLRRTPGFTVMVVLSLAVGVGGTTTMFSVVDAVDYRPLPFPSAERLVTVHEVAPAGSPYCRPTLGCELTQTSLLTASDWQDQFTTLDAVAMVRLFAEARWRQGDESEPIRLVEVSGNLFSLFGARPFLGRGFLPSELLPGAEPVLLLSYEFWRSRFGGDPSVVGTRISMIDLTRRSERAFTIVGVMPKRFRVLAEEAWSPVLPLQISGVDPRRLPEVLVLGRLATGRTVAEARAEARTIAARLSAVYPETNAGWTAEVHPFSGPAAFEFWSFGEIRTPGRGRHLLLGVVSLVLLVAALNVAALFLVRGLARQQELAVRRALGAPRARLARQLVIEGLCATGAGGGLGVLLSIWGVRVVRAALSIDAFPFQIGVDARALSFAVLVTVATGLAVSTLPALRLSGLDPAATLREHALRSPGLRRSRTRRVLIGIEIACALMLLNGAGLVTKELRRLRYDEPGYDPNGLYELRLPLPAEAVREPTRQQAIAVQVLDGIRGTPGVEAASLGALSRLDLPERPGLLPSNAHLAVSPEFFRTSRIRILRGRTFDSSDALGAPLVAILDENAARRLWPGEDAIGRSLVLRHGRGPVISVNVVGVAARSKLFWFTSLTSDPQPLVYRPIAQSWDQARGAVNVYARLTGDANRTLPALRTVLYQASGKPVDRTEVVSLEGKIATELRQQRFDTSALNTFALFALLLAGMGIYGVVANTVTQRSRELGIRMALGADRASVLILVTRQALALAVAGTLGGIGGSLALTHVLASFLGDTSPTDVAVFTISAATLVMVAVVASLVPARTAVAVDPVTSLRAE
jgi:predicted permease